MIVLEVFFPYALSRGGRVDGCFDRDRDRMFEWFDWDDNDDENLRFGWRMRVIGFRNDTDGANLFFDAVWDQSNETNRRENEQSL